MTAPQNLLVLGDYPVGFANGIGETLGNLLEKWPDDRLFQIYPSHLAPLAGKERGRAIPFEMPRRPAWVPPWLQAGYYPILKLQQVLAARALYARAATTIRDCGIGAILTYPVTPWVLFAAVRLRRRFPDVRFVFYVMDDWEGHHTCFGLPFTARRRNALNEMVATANVRFACSHRMRDDYERRFGNAWQVLHKGVPAGSLAPARPLQRPWKILYAGGMNVFRADAVLAFAEGLRLFRSRSGQDVTFTLLGAAGDPVSEAAMKPFEFVRLEPWASHADCQLRMHEADLLYLPLSMLPKVERIANLAMPTKFSEYLASGRPVIFHVPRASEVQDLAAQAGLPLTLNSVDPSAVCDLLMRLDRDGLKVDDYQDKARVLLAQEFDESVLQARLAGACFSA